MSIEEILNTDVATLAAMTDAELYNHLQEHFQYTRPERLELEAKSKSKKSLSIIENSGEVKAKPLSKSQQTKLELAALMQAAGLKI